jgi:3-oxoacyl-(acyl-carrier-protein) synthase
VGDIAEVKAIKKVFTDTSGIKMNATKSMIGHCLGAAAGIEAVAVVKAIQTGWLHPTLNQDNLVEEVAGIDTVPNEKKQHKVGCRVLCCVLCVWGGGGGGYERAWLLWWSAPHAPRTIVPAD